MRDNSFFKDWDDLVDKLSLGVGQIQEGEMTVRMFCKRYGARRVTACQKLRTLYTDGLATRRWVYEEGKKVYAYQIIQAVPDMRESDTPREVLRRTSKRRLSPARA